MKHGATLYLSVLLVLQFLYYAPSYGQTPDIEKLRLAVREHPQKDTIRVNRLNKFAIEARRNTPKETLEAATEALQLSNQLQYTYGEGIAYLTLGFYHRFRSEYKPAIEFTQQALNKFRELDDTLQQIICLYNLAYTYSYSKSDPATALSYSFDGMKLAESIRNQKWMILLNTQLGNLFVSLGDNKKGKKFLMDALTTSENTGDSDGVAHCVLGLGLISDEEENWNEALQYYQRGKSLAVVANDPSNIINAELSIADMKERQGKYAEVFPMLYHVIEERKKIDRGPAGISYPHNVLARAFLHTGKPDSAIYYGLKSLQATQQLDRKGSSQWSSKVLSEAYAMKGQFKEAYHYQLLYILYKDSLNLKETIRRSTALEYTFDIEKKQSEISLLKKNQELSDQKSRQQKLLLFGTVGGLLMIGGLSLFLLRNNRQKQKAYAQLQKQQEELKTTQRQLIQSEKMASLGELTAGIAHEIQNPLNFVNNFSEVNNELIEELKGERLKAEGERDAKAEDELLNDISKNLEKINHHGRRADAIVKGMLQHSRSSSGTKEPTDINALADEYLRLSYHGLRAKDKSFNAEFKTDFDESIGKINVIPQDIGRVLLNLYNNAFYAVSEKLARAKASVGKYEPTVSVSTRKENGKIYLSVKDNGNGIPQEVMDKIYQPFFTTKPTGQGTGLGLSLSYDIVKAHGGELKVETEEGEGSEFIIQLPIV